MGRTRLERTENVRYAPFTRKLSMWQTLRHAMTHCEWKRTETVFNALFPKDDGYDEAPYGASIVHHGKGLVLKLRKKR